MSELDPAIKDAWSWPPERMEAVAGKLLVLSARARAARMGPNDAHEIRHLYAAVVAGNTDGEEPGACKLDTALMDDFLARTRVTIQEALDEAGVQADITVMSATTWDGKPFVGDPKDQP